MQEQSSQFSLPFVKQFFDKIFNSKLRKTHYENLCRSVFGLISSQSGLISEIARPITRENSVSFKHTLKRTCRFLANVGFKPEKVLVLWVKWSASQFASENRLRIAIDWTTLPGNIQCLMAAIPFHGRAIPIYFRITPYGEFEKSQNIIEEHFLKSLIRMLPKEIRPVIIADRGFGRAALFRFFLSLSRDFPLDFAIRVKSEVWVTMESGVRRKLSRMKIKPDRSRWYQNITYREDGLVSGVNLAAAATEDSLDYWFVITNLTDKEETISLYAERFQIEEFFKDGKHQLGIADMQTPDRKRIYRLVCIACLSYGLLTIVGRTLEEHKDVQNKLIVADKQKRISYIWLALKAIRHNLIGAPIWQEALATLGP